MIIAIWKSIDPTRVIGMSAYATAAVCCGVALLRQNGRKCVARLAAGLMLLDCVLLLDMALNWRWRLHQAILEYAMRRQDYDRREAPQIIALTLLGGLLVLIVIVGRRALQGRGTTFLAFLGGALSAVMWFVEVVSLHAVDYLLYSSLVGVKAICFLWILACTMTSVGISLDPN